MRTFDNGEWPPLYISITRSDGRVALIRIEQGKNRVVVDPDRIDALIDALRAVSDEILHEERRSS